MRLLKLDKVTPRDYQKNIAETASQKNTLVVLPTGMGKTLIAVLVATNRLEKFPDSKILVMAPTRPLNAQHTKSFQQFTNIPEEQIILITGKTKPEDRVELYNKAKVIVATPQTIQNDVKNEKVNLENFSFAVFDEAHRSVKDYAYPYIAKKYMLQSKNPLILGLTASPGGNPEKIYDIMENLFIKAVEIRTETDLDVEKYVKLIEKEFVYVDFPEEFKKIRDLLKEILKDDLYWLKEHHYIPTYGPTKSMLIALQNRSAARYSQTKNYALVWPLIRSAEAIKLEHAIGLLETQGVEFLNDFMKKLQLSKKKTDTRLMKNSKMVEAVRIVEDVRNKTIEHPKLEKVKDIVKDLLKERPDSKIIIFANFRSTVDKIKGNLLLQGVKTETLVGQAIKNGRGMSQEQQIEILKKFGVGDFNVLVTSSIGEEGLDIPTVDYAIFYEPVPSEIRAIQRRGRVGRHAAGKIIFLITKDTRDEAHFFAALRKEKKMKGILYDMKEGKRLERKKNLIDWVKQ